MAVSTPMPELDPALTPNQLDHLSSKKGLTENTNYSFVLSPSRQFSYEEKSIPELRKSTDVRVRVIATGLCGSDIHYWQHGRIGKYVVDAPIVLGHESAGIVEACGPGVKHLTVGDRVALEPADVVIDATGAEPCINCGVSVLKRGGVFVQAGLGNPRIAFPIGEICDKEATLKGSFRYGPGDYKLAIQLLQSNRVHLGDLITHEFSFSEAEEAFKNVSTKAGIKTLIYGPGVDKALVDKTEEEDVALVVNSRL
ncbi:Endo-1,4-beta-xylanase 2 [Kalmusia sp. IMI 367209]|nr:Endo-1,4-beta-xylanase 2 [Kalmusia sp. IMI 367209]